MTAADFAKMLIRLNACEEAREWAKGKTLRRAWTECPRGDWPLWLAEEVGVDRKLIVLAACDCARTALKYVSAGEERPRSALETTEAWCRGEATLAEVSVAEAAAEAAVGAATESAERAAAGAAAGAAWDAVGAATESAERAAAWAAEAAAWAAGASGAAGAAAVAASRAARAAWAAEAAAQQETANLVRARIPLAAIEAAAKEKP